MYSMSVPHTHIALTLSCRSDTSLNVFIGRFTMEVLFLSSARPAVEYTDKLFATTVNINKHHLIIGFINTRSMFSKHSCNVVMV